MKVNSSSLVLLACLLLLGTAAAQNIAPSLVLKNSQTKDQDDMCIWIHPTDAALSTIIAADKVADMLFVYDLNGNTLQTIEDGSRPGNIDVRYHFPLDGDSVPIVGFNDRRYSVIVVYKVDVNTRRLQRIDDGKIKTIANYGFCLYKSPVSGKFYGFVTSKSGKIQQIELYENGGKVSGTVVRSFALNSKTEGCVCDDETGLAYFGEESEGIWKIGGEPEDGTSPQIIAEVGDESGLADDVEGLTIYYAANGEGYLIASSQGDDKFTVLERKPPHRPVGEFKIDGVGSTDGIDVTNVPLNDNFSQGIFTYHNGKKSPYPIGVTKWEVVAAKVGNGLMIDTGYWNPSKAQTTPVAGADSPLPASFSLAQNYPNPFNPQTTIEFAVQNAGHYTLKIHDLLGRPIRTLVDGKLQAGTYQVRWDARHESGRPVAAGTYIYTLRRGGQVVSRKLTLVK